MIDRVVGIIVRLVGPFLERVGRAFEPYHPEDEELWQTDEPQQPN